MKIMSLWLFARIAAAISVIFLVSIATLNKGQVLAQIANARLWTCGDGAGKEMGMPQGAVWDPDAERMIFAPPTSNPGYTYLMSWDITKRPDTGCVALAFDGTNTATTASTTGSTAKTKGAHGIVLLFDASSNIQGYITGDNQGHRLIFIAKTINNPVTFAYGDGTGTFSPFIAGTGTSGKIPYPSGGCAHRNTKKHYFSNGGGMGLFTWNSGASALDGSQLISYAFNYVDGPIASTGRVSSIRGCAIAFEADTTTASVMFLTASTYNALHRLTPVSSSGVLSTIAVDNTDCPGFSCGINVVLAEMPSGDVTLIWSTIRRYRSSFARVTPNQLVNEGVAGSATAFSWTHYSLVDLRGSSFMYGVYALPNGTLITLLGGYLAFAVHDYKYWNISSYAAPPTTSSTTTTTTATTTPTTTMSLGGGGNSNAGASSSFGGGCIGVLILLAFTTL
jgi:hypothetical protein